MVAHCKFTMRAVLFNRINHRVMIIGELTTSIFKIAARICESKYESDSISKDTNRLKC